VKKGSSKNNKVNCELLMLHFASSCSFFSSTHKYVLWKSKVVFIGTKEGQE
jgi:hypothetical protein